MNPMSIRDAINSSPRESFSTNEPLSVVGVCLDEDTWTVLKQFAESAPLIRLRSHLSEYRVQETDSASDWLGDPPPDICLVDFDRDRRRAAMAAENIHSAAPETAVFAVSTDAQPDLIIQAMRSGCSEYLLKPMGRGNAPSPSVPKFWRSWAQKADAASPVWSPNSALCWRTLSQRKL